MLADPFEKPSEFAPTIFHEGAIIRSYEVHQGFVWERWDDTTGVGGLELVLQGGEI